MKIAANNVRAVAGIAGVLLLLAAAQGASSEAPEVLIHGLGQWTETTANGIAERNPVGIVDTVSGKAGTSIYFRQDFGKQEWQRLNRMQSQVGALTGYAGELVILLKSGAWEFDSPSRFSYGRQLPGDKPDEKRILAIAGDRTSLWALSHGKMVTTSATTRSEVVSAIKTLAALGAPPQVLLYEYTGDDWTAMVAPWPQDTKFAEGSLFSMVVLPEDGEGAAGGTPAVAIWSPQSNGASPRSSNVQILKYSKKEMRWRWVDELKVEPAPLKAVKLLNWEGRLAVWIRSSDEDAQAGLGEIRVGKKSIRIPFSGVVPGPGMVDLTVAGNVIWIAFKSNGKLMQQRLDLDGKPLDPQHPQPAAVIWSEGGSSIVLEWPTVAIMVAIAMMVFFNLFRRRAAREGNNEEDDEE